MEITHNRNLTDYLTELEQKGAIQKEIENKK